MTSISNPLKDAVIAYCAYIGADSMLVQGAGGNVSWKDGETLWIKASGTFLADASRKEIFVPVDLTHLQRAIASGDFQVSPRLSRATSLRPSIETLLHAVMPHNVVVHLHAVKVLSYLVRTKGQEEIRSLVGNTLRCLSIGYYKPGGDLAKAIYKSLNTTLDVEVVFLKNHGVVIGGKDVETVNSIMEKLLAKFNTSSRNGVSRKIVIPRETEINKLGYQLITTPEITQLVLDPSLYRRVKFEWALYPDHVVFLGPKAYCFDNVDEFLLAASQINYLPELGFVQDTGVFISKKISDAKKAQIKCYAEVISRQSDDEKLDLLTVEQINDLLEWDAEIYRKNLFSLMEN